MQKRWLDITEAAAHTTLAVGTLRKMVSRREINHIKKGKRTIFDVKDLDAFMERDKIFAKERGRSRPAVESDHIGKIPSEQEVYQLLKGDFEDEGTGD
jgi:excisionase family DNA binding protein